MVKRGQLLNHVDLRLGRFGSDPLFSVKNVPGSSPPTQTKHPETESLSQANIQLQQFYSSGECVRFCMLGLCSVCRSVTIARPVNPYLSHVPYSLKENPGLRRSVVSSCLIHSKPATRLLNLNHSTTGTVKI